VSLSCAIFLGDRDRPNVRNGYLRADLNSGVSAGCSLLLETLRGWGYDPKTRTHALRSEIGPGCLDFGLLGTDIGTLEETTAASYLRLVGERQKGTLHSYSMLTTR
jgi:hypothetical protein